MSNKYIALTIGPIYGTIRKARRTRELWAASYLFSHLMKELCAKLKDRGTILLPKEPKAAGDKPGVGLYPDMLILEWKGENGDSGEKGEALTEVMQMANGVKVELAVAIAKDIKNQRCQDQGTTLEDVKRMSESDLKQYFENYLRIFGVEATLDELKAITQGITGKPPNDAEAITTGCGTLLANLELRPAMAHLDPDPMRGFLSLANQSFLKGAAFSDAVTRFPSLYEVATQELRMLNDKTRKEYEGVANKDFDRLRGKKSGTGDNEAEPDLYHDLERGGFAEHLHQYHRYGVYVHADGDGIGKVVRSMDSTAKLGQLSQALTDFAVNANKAMAGERFTAGSATDHGWGAVPVYIGGDDLLMLAPVVSRQLNGEPKTIFDLVEQADKVFKAKVANGSFIGNGVPKPTLSFGIGINYVKAPMREANEEAHELLAHVKGDRYKLRDRLHLRITKHSGGSFSAVYYKGDAGGEHEYPTKWNGETGKFEEKEKLTVWGMTLKLVETHAIPIDRKDPEAKNGAFLNSLIAKVREQRAVLRAIAGDKDHIEAWFDNTFNEAVHGRFRERLFPELAAYVHAGHAQAEYIANQEPVDVTTAFDEFLDCLYMTLRFIQFIRGHDQA